MDYGKEIAIEISSSLNSSTSLRSKDLHPNIRNLQGSSRISSSTMLDAQETVQESDGFFIDTMNKIISTENVSSQQNLITNLTNESK